MENHGLSKSVDFVARLLVKNRHSTNYGHPGQLVLTPVYIN